MKIRTTLLIGLAALLIFNCGQFKKTATGDYNALTVIASLEDWFELKEICSEVFEKEHWVPQPEQSTVIYHNSPEDWSMRKRDRNIVFAATLNTKGPMKEFIETMLTPELKSGVENGEYFYFIREDVWAKGQFVLILVSKDIETLKKNIDENRENLYNLVEQKLIKWQENLVYRHGYNKDFTNKMLEEHNFTFKFPYDFHLAFTSPEKDFYWIRRWNPDRFISVYFEDAGSGSKIDSLWVLNKRDELARKYMDESEVDKDYNKFTFSYVNFLEKRAARLAGTWKIPRKVIGGPFINYTFYDEQHSKIVMIDLAVFNPDLDNSSKLPYLRQLEAIAVSFKFGN